MKYLIGHLDCRSFLMFIHYFLINRKKTSLYFLPLFLFPQSHWTDSPLCPAAVSSILLFNNALAACLVEVEAETWDNIGLEEWFTC
jgi:hypothetical protein